MTPWFEAFREQYIQRMRVSDHEYIRHYIACICSVYFICIDLGNRRFVKDGDSLKSCGFVRTFDV